MIWLLDTNIFLEVLFGQEESAKCESFLRAHLNDSAISAFSLQGAAPEHVRRYAAWILSHDIDDQHA